MRRAAKLLSLPVLVITGALAMGACGSEGVDVAQDSPFYEGAELFAARCSGCHTLSAAGSEGSASSIKYQERTDGPNLDERRESVDDVLFAIRNGGFSGAIMPQNIVVGQEAEAVARFVANYAGSQAGGEDETSEPGGGDTETTPEPPAGTTPEPPAGTTDEPPAGTTETTPEPPVATTAEPTTTTP